MGSTSSYLWRPSDDVSPLFGFDERFGEGIQRNIPCEKLFEHCAENEHASSLELILVEKNRDFEPARETNRAGCLRAAHDGCGLRRADSFFDLFL